MADINSVKTPNVIEELDYEKIKTEIIEDIIQKVPEYEPLESDIYMPVIEAVAYREMLLRARINDAVKGMLLPTATGEDLDRIIEMYAIERLPGVKPQTDIQISLSTELTYDVIIPRGTRLTDKEWIYTSRLLADVVIAAGEKQGTGRAELDEYVAESSVKTEIFKRPLPFVATAKQPGIYKNGYGPETDEAFRVRAVQSLERFSTAGVAESYKYHTLSANPQIQAVQVSEIKDAPGHVRVVIQVNGDDEAQDKARLDAEIALEKVRPLTDIVTVGIADCIDVKVKAELELFDLQEQAEVLGAIEAAFKSKVWTMGEDLNLSYVYKMLHEEGVYRVNLIEPSSDRQIQEDEYIQISLEVTCTRIP